MLPTELLVVRKRKDAMQPRYVEISQDNLQVAASLIDAYKQHVGEKKKVLKELVAELEDEGYDYRFIRGLSFLLDRKSVFKCNSEINPENVRRKVFHTTTDQGVPTTVKARKQLLESVASELKTTAQVVEESLYADLESELSIEAFEPPTPQDLLLEYNLSLAQTLLFDSVELVFTASGNWQSIFYNMKRLGLIYEATQTDNEVWVKVDGPASLFKLTRRYGTAIAKLLPIVVSNSSWTIKAKVMRKFTNQIYHFDMDSSTHGILLRKPKMYAVTYDSAVEEDFAQRFEALDTGWKIRREPEPIPVGNLVIIPDFSLEKDGAKVYVEIVGFWTKEYLLRKIDKLSKTDAHMLVAVDENLACERISELRKQGQLNVIYYKNKIPLAPILNHLQGLSKKTHEKQRAFLENLPIVFTEPVIEYDELAQRLGVSTEAVRTRITAKPPQGYVLLANSIVQEDKLQKIKEKIQKQTKQDSHLLLPQAIKIIEEEGVRDSSSALDILGFKVVWHGISAEKAEVLTKIPNP